MDNNDDTVHDQREGSEETYNPWSIVNLVFRHLADEGLHPVLGEAGDPGAPAAPLLRALGLTPTAEGKRQASARTRDEVAPVLRALGITPTAEGNRQATARTRDELAQLRAAFEESQGTRDNQ